MQQPPYCPQCPTHPLLWKDTTTTRPGADDRWRWYCTRCERWWEPTPEQKQRFTYGTPAGSGSAVRVDPRMPRH